MNPSENPVCQRLSIDFPILQAGMGGVAGPRLAAAVSRAGAGGILGLYKMWGADLEQWLSTARALTASPLGVNSIPELLPDDTLVRQVHTVLDSDIEKPFFTFFGLPSSWVARLINDSGCPLVIQVGTLDDAVQGRDLGADVLVLQNRQAGGHHLGSDAAAILVDSVRQAGVETTPLVAAGGISTGDDLVRMMTLGYSGAWCGTLFAACHESRAHDLYKQRIVAASAEDTLITEAFHLGWARRHRVLRNDSTNWTHDSGPGGPDGQRLDSRFIAFKAVGDQRYPIPRFSCAVPTIDTTGKIEEMAMYCGTSCARIRRLVSAQDIVEGLRRDFFRAIQA